MIDMLIIGSGALANVFAARCYHPDLCKLQVFGSWPDGIQAIHERGIRLTYHGETHNTPPVFASTDINQIRPAKFILLLVKSWQTAAIAALLPQKLQADGVCLTLQNGLGNLELLKSYLGNERVNAGTTTLGVTLSGPGDVQLHANGPILIGEHTSNAWVLPFFRSCGFEIQSNPNIESVLWGKLLVNAVINPLTALLDVENGALEMDAQLLSLADALIDEIVSVMQAKHIPLPYQNAHEYVRKIIHESRKNHSSMVQDMQRRAPTEIDFITGAILEEAKRLNLVLPANETIYRLVKSKVSLNS